MKAILAITVIVLCLFAPGASQMNSAPEPVLRHVVLFKFKAGTTPDQSKQVEEAFRALPGKISQVKGFEWGTNVSPEKLAQGYTHCFLLVFASDKDRDDYLVHPAHKEFGAVLKPYLDQALVIDFWTKH